MPVCIYECKSCEEQLEDFFPLDEWPETMECRDCKGEMFRNLAAEMRTTHIANDRTYGTKPSLAMECDVGQVEENKAHDRLHNCEVEYVPVDGGMSAAPVYSSRANQKRYEESRGHFNKDGGYGDSQRRKG